MALEVNTAMDIPEGKRKDAPAGKLRDTDERLDAIGDGLIQKVRAALAQKKGKQ